MPNRARFRTGDQTLVREINLSLILTSLREHTALSRASLADLTGLNKSTVSSLVQELLDRQFLREAGMSTAGTGRPSILLELNPNAGYIVSCEINVDFTTVIGTNFAADVLWRHQESTKPEQGQQGVIARMMSLLRQAIAARHTICPRCTDVLGIAIGVPGLVDRTSGTILFAPNLGWEQVQLASLLSQEFPEIPIFVDNEANLAAFGEYLFGAARGHDEILFINIGAGVGGAIIVAGELFKGTAGFASEFGHMTMDKNGLPCNCGNYGCWETQVSQSALFRYTREAIDLGQPSALRDKLGAGFARLSTDLIIEAAQAGDGAATYALEQVGQNLGIGIASLVNIFNPDLVVLGGGITAGGNLLIPIIRKELERRALRWSRETVDVVMGQHGSAACVIGGIAIVYETVLTQPSNMKV